MDFSEPFRLMPCSSKPNICLGRVHILTAKPQSHAIWPLEHRAEDVPFAPIAREAVVSMSASNKKWTCGLCCFSNSVCRQGDLEVAFPTVAFFWLIGMAFADGGEWIFSREQCRELSYVLWEIRVCLLLIQHSMTIQTGRSACLMRPQT